MQSGSCSSVGFQRGWKAWFAGLVVPGAGFWLCGRVALGCWCLALHALFLVLGVAAIGYPLGVAALAAAVVVHSVGIIGFVAGGVPGSGLVSKFGALLVPPVVYFKACLLAGEFLFFPVEIDGQVLVVSRLTKAAEVRVGDLVAFEQPERRLPGVQVRDGIELGEVLAMGGTRVDFGQQHLRTRAGVLPARYGMPSQGTILLAEKVWFIWPAEINTRRNPEAEPLLLQAAQVPHGALVGRVFRHWFGRVQTLP